ncbi:hypothetical protein ACIPY5_12260 [Microbacterium sp. NPDC089698]|uniref:hypothetical protein n=1 Tax=Microbacterium sp. NPDC089698 TaxID=3364200 RepID=UPI00381485F8
MTGTPGMDGASARELEYRRAREAWTSQKPDLHKYSEFYTSWDDGFDAGWSAAIERLQSDLIAVLPGSTAPAGKAILSKVCVICRTTYTPAAAATPTKEKP